MLLAIVQRVDDQLTGRLAELAVRFGAGVQPGQTLIVNSQIESAPLARAIAGVAYQAGARHVEVSYSDAWVRRARIEHGVDEAIGYAPPWQVDRIHAIGAERVALISLEAALDPAATEGLDPARLGADQSPVREAYLRLVVERLINWCIIACPTPPWAAQVHPDLPADEALARLSREIAHMCRLDDADPVAAWKQRFDRLAEVGEWMTAQRFDAIHLRGEGTDLTVGLFPSSRWLSAEFETANGLVHHPNLPTEELFTTPDPARTQGVVRSTKPLDIDGTLITGLNVEFDGGRAVRIDADTNAELLRSRAGRDDGAARLGELALVDGEGRIGALDTVFYSTLIDENAASHIALGSGLTHAVGEDEEQSRVNESSIHIDFMIGSPEVDVDGVHADRRRVPVLRGGRWQI
jgi:aminopeptidase